MTILLTQQEADALLAREKHFLGDDRFDFPALGGALRIPLHSSDRREEFSLDITRGRILLEKNTFQTRAQSGDLGSSGFSWTAPPKSRWRGDRLPASSSVPGRLRR